MCAVFDFEIRDTRAVPEVLYISMRFDVHKAIAIQTAVFW